MTRGDIARVALQGAYGKPRPALIIQSDIFADHPSVTVLPITSDLRELSLLRIRLEPSDLNGLRETSDVMVDKAQSVPREKLGAAFGRASRADLQAVDRALLIFLGLV